MGKRIVAVSSSPRAGGNSDILCEAFIRGAKEAGNVVDKLQLNKLNLLYCDGCARCFYEKVPCPKGDAIAEVAKMMIAADVVVFATPLYFYMMSGRMKTFLDRACSYYDKMQDTEFYYIVSCADQDPHAIDRVVEGFRGFARCIDGAVEKGIIYGNDAWHEGDVTNSKALEESYQMGLQV